MDALDLKYLITYKTILESGSFMNAAHKLNYTQSTITFQMHQLEKELSVKLFEKIGRKMTVTQAGRDFLPYVDAVMHALEQLENFGKESTGLTGALRVAVAETLLTYHMPRVLKTFREKAPFVKLSVKCLNCYDMRGEIMSGTADLCVHYDVGGYGASIVKEDLAEFPLALVSSAHNVSHMPSVTGVGKHISVVTSDANGVYQRMFEKYLRKNQIVMDDVMNVGSVEAVKACVSTDVGVAALPRFAVAGDLKVGRLAEIESDFSKSTVSAVCTYHRNKHITPAMALFIRVIKEHFNK